MEHHARRGEWLDGLLPKYENGQLTQLELNSTGLSVEVPAAKGGKKKHFSPPGRFNPNSRMGNVEVVSPQNLSQRS